MRGIVISVIFFLAGAGSVFSQSTQKCDLAVLLETSKNTGSLSHAGISQFLHTMGQECRENVEYSEWSNELLFSVLDKQTEATLIVLYKKERSLEMDEILRSLEDPGDLISIDSLITKVEKTNPVNPMRTRVVAALKVARSKF
jgi:hypothetical protein